MPVWTGCIKGNFAIFSASSDQVACETVGIARKDSRALRGMKAQGLQVSTSTSRRGPLSNARPGVEHLEVLDTEFK